MRPRRVGAVSVVWASAVWVSAVWVTVGGMVLVAAFVSTGPTVSAAAGTAASSATAVPGRSGAASPSVRRSTSFSPPVDAPVIDPFRAPPHPYGPGNRGLEYATTPGMAVRAIGAGRVSFAGQVAGRLAVSVDHPGGLRSSVTDVASIVVVEGAVVHRGQILGTAAASLHLGVRLDGQYIDPASLFAATGPARLVVPP